jgi:hypothetical protein
MYIKVGDKINANKPLYIPKISSRLLPTFELVFKGFKLSFMSLIDGSGCTD